MKTALLSLPLLAFSALPALASNCVLEMGATMHDDASGNSAHYATFVTSCDGSTAVYSEKEYSLSEAPDPSDNTYTTIAQAQSAEIASFEAKGYKIVSVTSATPDESAEVFFEK